MDQWGPILARLEVPSVSQLKEQSITLSNAKSSAQDKVAIKTTRDAVLNIKLGKNRKIEGKSKNQWSSQKNGVLAMAADQILNGVGKFSSPKNPFSLGLRSVPARILRLIYNVPLNQQILLRPLYLAMSSEMKENKEFRMKQHTGVPLPTAIVTGKHKLKMMQK